jgi:hypothetical protein
MMFINPVKIGVKYIVFKAKLRLVKVFLHICLSANAFFVFRNISIGSEIKPYLIFLTGLSKRIIKSDAFLGA